MRRALLLALALWAARADDYAGGDMPQYAGAVDYERDERAPRAYGDEEPPSAADAGAAAAEDDAERWRSRERRPARGRFEERPKLRGPDTDAARRRRPVPRRAAPRRRAPARYAHVERDRDRDRAAHYLDDYHDDANLEDDDLVSTTAKIIRRKPRDRVFAPLPPSISKSSRKERDFVYDEADEKSDRPVKEDKAEERELWSSDDREWPAGWARPTLPGPDARVEPADPDRDKPDAYQDYNDYYNIKKLQNLKTRIPILPRRTTASEPMVLQPLLWTRRAGGGAAHAVPAFLTPSHTPPTAAPAPPATDPWALLNVTELSLAEKFKLIMREQLKPEITEPPTTSRATTETRKTATTKSTTTTPKTTTKKPPVLLLVTRQLPTVVMVEPGVHGDPWFRRRAQQAGYDSPAVLNKVKRAMRAGLMARAGSLRELTENWNDTVCEYVDVDALAGAAPPSALLALPFALALLVNA